MENVKHLIKGFVPVLILLFLCNIGIYAQSGISIRGTVVDKNNEAIIGASVIVKGRGNTGTVSDLSGQFTLTVPNSNTTIVISYIGMKTKEMKIGNSRNIKVTLEEDNAQLNEVVVVGYGQQKKASVVGAITQTDAKTLERYSGVPSLGQALTGNLPGVITSS